MSDAATLTSEDEAAFRQRCRDFLEVHATGNTPAFDPRGDIAVDAGRAFQRKLADAGLAGLTYPAEFGGAGLTKAHETIWREEAAMFPLMTAQLTISQGMCLPMLSDHGTDAQKQTYMAKVISGEELWCQMFSEPGAGSDVASLQTRAVRDGDEYVINGQKVWTTLAHLCDKGILIARTNPDAPKHRGISMFIVDMTDPAVEVRAINQIDGGQRFNEVFFNDLRVPADHLIPDENEGWRLATAMLMYERVAIGTGQTSGIRHDRADQLIREATDRGTIGDRKLRQRLMKLYSDESAQSLVAMRTRAELQAGKTPGPGGSLGKLAGAKIAAQYRDLSLQIVGGDGIAWDNDDTKGGRWSLNALGTFSSGIAGGTNEIQKNIIGDRVLGLPREPSVDKDVPFRDLKVGTQSTPS